METKSPCALILAFVLAAAIAVPADTMAAPQTAAQRAGEVSRLIPAVSIARGPKTITASPKSVVDWEDLVNTQANARARIALDDGSVLNVGSDSSFKVVKHDAGAQQTQLELAYGKLRTQAQKIVKPDGKFEVRTPAGVAGVVGTDFYVGYENDTMNVIAYEGQVRVCDLAGLCVIVKAGQITIVRHGNNSGPTPPAQAGLDALVAASKDTDVPGKSPGIERAGHLGKGSVIIGGIAAAVPVVVIGIVASRSSSPPPPQTKPPGNCPNPAAGCG
jgi:ferric-dicitrate binding protein FerR (iron transport regulator)